MHRLRYFLCTTLFTTSFLVGVAGAQTGAPTPTHDQKASQTKEQAGNTETKSAVQGTTQSKPTQTKETPVSDTLQKKSKASQSGFKDASCTQNKAPVSDAASKTPQSKSVDETINDVVQTVTGPFVATIFHSVEVGDTKMPLIVGWLVIAAIIFTLFFGFIQIRGIKHAVELVKGDFSDPNHKGEVSHFQALTTALSGTVGLGNIAGVAVAVSIGGPGATFWMIVAGLLGMASKFCECTLGVKYRNEYEDGSVSGGPMYYLSKGFSERFGEGHLFGRFLAGLFAVFCIFGALGGGNMFQANQAHSQLVGITGGAESFLNGNGWITGCILSAVVFLVIVGGIKSIAQVTEKIVPLMAVLYVGAALIILGMNADKIVWAFGQIFSGAFSELGVAGGVIGALIQGFKRAAFSNEAGVGSAAIAHSAVKTDEPITEGLVSLLEPFIDTVVICTMTALVIIITGQLEFDSTQGIYIWGCSTINTLDGKTGVELTSAAFESSISWFPYVLAVSVVLFAFSTMISWSYYGLKAWGYLFGESPRTQLVFKIVFCAFVIIGAAMSLGPVIDFSDAAIFAMALVNIVGLYFLMPIVKTELNRYMTRLKNGEIKRFKG